MSISENVEFMPNINLPPLRKPRKLRKLEDEEWEGEAAEESSTGAWEEYDPYSSNHLWRVCQNMMNTNKPGGYWAS